MKRKKMSPFGKVMITSLSIIVVFSLVSFFVSKQMYDNQFPRHETPDWRVFAGINYDHIRDEYPYSENTFQSGENILNSYVFGKENDKGLVVVAHGLGGGAESYLAQILYFVDHGWKVFAYDCTGSYASQGESTIGFPQSVLDLNAALDHIKSSPSFDDPKILLFGHSWGGYAVANVLNFDKHDISGIVSVSGANNAIEYINGQAKEMMGIFAITQYPFLSLYQNLLFGEVARFSAVDGLNNSNIPALIIHSENDSVIKIPYAIFSKQDEIKNENVVFLERTREKSDGHNSIFKSQSSLTYMEEINKEYRKVYEDYDQNIPFEVKVEMYASFDDDLVSELDKQLMDRIVAFFEKAIIQ